ncbi:MAG: DNA-binding response regulator [Chloroflexi bacterium]|nr:MAG: DNA-binding response regulator [Chloroflexota bacterium]
MSVQPRLIRVVLIDDHEIVRNGLKYALEGDAWFSIVGEADDGPEGIRLVEATSPDVVLLDVRLPTLSGADVCSILSERAPQARVLILSAFGDEDLVYQCILAGARGYILKDIGHFDLRKSLEAVVRGESVIDPRVASGLFERIRAGASPAAPVLPPHQFSVLRLMAGGFSNREIAERLYLSENTVKGYVQEVLRRLGARNRLDAVMIAVRNGWIQQ